RDEAAVPSGGTRTDVVAEKIVGSFFTRDDQGTEDKGEEKSRSDLFHRTESSQIKDEVQEPVCDLLRLIDRTSGKISVASITEFGYLGTAFETFKLELR
ncbi:MAG TPA: hypothetical protein DCP63_11880, partial [Bacteroidetes bacterium]|nr:hypothetical protein [Bacteroidota bacterium]